ncbi:MAG: hypothetical protein ACE5PM_00590 [Candidatus Hydrothermarchaeales archaeon]
MKKKIKGEVAEKLERYIQATSQYATLAGVRKERMNKFMDLVAKSKGGALSQGEVISALYNIVEVDGRIFEVLDKSNDVLFETVKLVSGVE